MECHPRAHPARQFERVCVRARLDALEEAVQVCSQALAHARQRHVIGQAELVAQAALAEEGHPVVHPAIGLRRAANRVVHRETELACSRVLILLCTRTTPWCKGSPQRCWRHACMHYAQGRRKAEHAGCDNAADKAMDQLRTAGSARCMRARPAPRSAMLGRPCMSRFSMMMKLPLPRNVPPARGSAQPADCSCCAAPRRTIVKGHAHRAAKRTARAGSQRTKVVHLGYAESLCVCRVLRTRSGTAAVAGVQLGGQAKYCSTQQARSLLAKQYLCRPASVQPHHTWLSSQAPRPGTWSHPRWWPASETGACHCPAHTCSARLGLVATPKHKAICFQGCIATCMLSSRRSPREKSSAGLHRIKLLRLQSHHCSIRESTQLF